LSDFHAASPVVDLPSRRHFGDWLGFSQFPFPHNSMDKVARKKKDVAAAKAAESPSIVLGTNANGLDAKRRPLATIRVEDCSASIWAREHVVQGSTKIFYSVTLERSYKDRDGAWKYTRSFDPDSLGKLVSLCQQASERIDTLTQPSVAV